MTNDDSFNGNIIFDKDYVLVILEKYLPIKNGGKISDLKIEKTNLDKIHSFMAKYLIKSTSSITELLAYGVIREEKTNLLIYESMKLANKNRITKQMPIYYDKHNDILFYLGVQGTELLQYIQENLAINDQLIKDIGKKLAMLHIIPIPVDFYVSEFKLVYSTIDPANIFSDKKTDEKWQFQDKIKNLFTKIVVLKDRLPSDKTICFSHGDFHPGNVIVERGNTTISIIDYSSVCLANYCLDLGIFLQQLQFMCEKFIPQDEIMRFQKIFLESYFEKRKIEMDISIRNNIYLFQALSSLHVAVFLLSTDNKEDLANRSISQAEEFLENIIHSF